MGNYKRDKLSPSISSSNKLIKVLILLIQIWKTSSGTSEITLILKAKEKEEEAKYLGRNSI